MSKFKVLETTDETITYQVTIDTRPMFDEFILIEGLQNSFYAYAETLGIKRPTGKMDLEEALAIQGFYLMLIEEKPEIKKTEEGYRFQEMAAGYIRSLQALQALGFLELFYQTSKNKSNS